MGKIRDRADWVMIAVVLAMVPLLPGRLSAGAFGIGATTASSLALHAAGLVLVYRASGVVNFSQVQMGLVVAGVFTLMANYSSLFQVVRIVCPPCLGWTTPLLSAVNYWLSFVAALGLSMLLTWLIYVLVIKRLSRAPRLLMTVATIFLAQGLAGLQEALPTLLRTEEQRAGQVRLTAPELPFDFQLRVGSGSFHAPSVLKVVVTAFLFSALVVYIGRSRFGAAIRASSENLMRAQTLGIDVDKVQGRAWLLAGTLSGVAGLMDAIDFGTGGQRGFSAEALIPVLAVALIARFRSFGITIAAALALGMLQIGFVAAFRSDRFVSTLFLAVIAVALVVQRYRRSTDAGRSDELAPDNPIRETRPVPRELRDLTEVKRGRWVLSVFLFIALIAVPFYMSSSQSNLIALLMIYALIGVSILILTGWAGQISLGQFGLAAVGSFVLAVLELPMPLALLLAGLSGAAAAAVLGLPALKLRGVHLAIMSLTFAAAVPNVLLNRSSLGRLLPTAVQRPKLGFLDFSGTTPFYYLVLAVLTIAVAGAMGLRRSKFASSLIAARDNEPKAESIGLPILKIRLAAFAVSGFLAGLSGGLFVYHQGAARAEAYPPEQSLTMFIFAVVGGLGSVAGPLIGALYWATLSIGDFGPVVTFLATGPGGLVLLLLLPGGLSQLVFGLRDAALRRIAERKAIPVPSLMGAGLLEKGLAPIAPKVGTGGTAEFVPERYRLRGQWTVESSGPSGDLKEQPVHG